MTILSLSSVETFYCVYFLIVLYLMVHDYEENRDNMLPMEWWGTILLIILLIILYILLMPIALVHYLTNKNNLLKTK